MSKIRVGTFLGRPPSEHSERLLPRAITVKRRANIYHEQQAEKLQDALRDLERAKLDQNHAQTTMEREFYQQHVKVLQERYDKTMIVLLAVEKLYTELDLARNSLENGIWLTSDVNLVRKRIRFLEERIRCLVHETDIDVRRSLSSSSSSSELNTVVDQIATQLSLHNHENKLPLKTSVSFVNSTEQHLTGGSIIQKPNEHVANKTTDNYSGTNSPDVKEMTSDLGRNAINSILSSNSSPRSVFLTESPCYQGASPGRDAGSPKSPSYSWQAVTKSDANGANGANYWNTEHHRLSYSSLRNVDSLFYHQMGLSVQDSYVNNVQPIGDLSAAVPRRKSSDVSDVQLKALDDLSKQVGKLYFRVREASKLSVNFGVDQLCKENDFNEGSMSRSSTARQSTQGGSIVTLSSPRRLVKLVPLRTHALPLAKTTKGVEFPRSSDIFSSSIPGHDSPALRIVDQRDLQVETDAMLSQFIPKSSVQIKLQSVESRFRHLLAIDAKRAESSVADKCRMQEQADELVRNEPLKWKRIQDLIGLTQIANDRVDDRIDATRQLGVLNCTDSRVLEALRKVLEKDVDERVIYEAAKSLVSLGCWCEEVQKQLIHYLLDGSRQVKCDLLCAMANGQPVAEEDKKYPTFADLCRIVTLLSRDDDVTNELSFHAAVCSCHTFHVNDNHVTLKLEAVLNASKNMHYKAKALELLVNQAKSVELKLTKSILDQLQHSAVWTYRRNAARHLVRFSSLTRPQPPVINIIYDVMFVVLSSDVNQHVRSEVGKALASFDLMGRVCQDIDRLLFDESSEKARANAVIAIGTLGLKTERVLKTLLDMAELDVSHRVRHLVIRTLGQLSSRDHRVLELLRTSTSSPDERIAKEAKKSLKALNV